MASPHILKLTKGARSLALSVLNIPEQFKTLQDMNTALTVAAVLNIEEKVPSGAEDLGVWVVESSPVEVTETQRDLLKKCCTDQVSKLPINTHTLLLLTELGLTS